MSQPLMAYYLLPPRRGFKWTALHSFMLVMVAIHLVFFVIYGIQIPKLERKEQKTYVVNLVKDIQRSSPPAPKAKTEKKTGPKTEVKREPAVVPKDVPNKAAPNKPDIIEPPKVAPALSAEAKYPVFTPDPNSHKDGAPSGQSNGKPDSSGAGGSDRIGDGGGGGGDGGPGEGGHGGGTRPWVFWDYRNDRGLGDTTEARGNTYQRIKESPPVLADAVVPGYEKLVGLGRGVVTMELIIPAADEFPYRGIKPKEVRVVKIAAEDPKQRDRMGEMAKECGEASGWFPAKKDGRTFEEKITFDLVFHGQYTYGEDD